MCTGTRPVDVRSPSQRSDTGADVKSPESPAAGVVSDVATEASDEDDSSIEHSEEHSEEGEELDSDDDEYEDDALLGDPLTSSVWSTLLW